MVSKAKPIILKWSVYPKQSPPERTWSIRLVSTCSPLKGRPWIHRIPLGRIAKKPQKTIVVLRWTWLRSLYDVTTAITWHAARSVLPPGRRPAQLPPRRPFVSRGRSPAKGHFDVGGSPGEGYSVTQLRHATSTGQSEVKPVRNKSLVN